MHAQRQQRIAVQPQPIKLLTLFQGHLIVATTEIDCQMTGDGAQLSDHVLTLSGQGSGGDEGANGFSAATLGVIAGAAQRQFQGHFQRQTGLC
ncbi:hypothetical protein D3C87_2020540 [compost metagenome]